MQIEAIGEDLFSLSSLYSQDPPKNGTGTLSHPNYLSVSQSGKQNGASCSTPQILPIINVPENYAASKEWQILLVKGNGKIARPPQSPESFKLLVMIRCMLPSCDNWTCLTVCGTCGNRTHVDQVLVKRLNR